MTPVVTLGVLLAFLFVVLSRSVYRFIQPSLHERDAFAHLLFMKDIREAGHRVPERPTSVLTGGIYSYPFLLHWLLSFLPERLVTFLTLYFSPILDAAYVCFVVVLSLSGVITTTELLIILVFFATAPDFMPPNRAESLALSGRKFGLLITTGAILALSLWTVSSQALLLVGAVVLSAAVFLSSKFSLQALTFILIGFTVTGTPEALGVLLLGGLAAVLGSGGVYWTVLRGHVRHLYEYALTQQFKISMTAPTNNLLDELRERHSVRDLLELAFRSHAIRPLAFNPFLIGVIVTYAVALTSGGISTLDSRPWVHIWVLSVVAAFILTSLPGLRFLGEADRYLDYGFLPGLLVIAAGWRQFGQPYDLFLGLLVLHGLAVIAVSIYVFRSEFHMPAENADFDDIMARLREHAPGGVLVQPLWRARELAWQTDHTVVDFVMNGGSTPAVVAERDHLCPSEYGYITDDVEWLAEQYDLDWAVFNVSRRDEFDDTELKPPAVEPEYENDHFQLYRFDSVAEYYRDR